MLLTLGMMKNEGFILFFVVWSKELLGNYALLFRIIFAEEGQTGTVVSLPNIGGRIEYRSKLILLLLFLLVFSAFSLLLSINIG